MQLVKARLDALEGTLCVVDGVREPAGREVERDAELVMHLGELARRQREQLRLERQAGAVVRDRLLKFL